MDDDSSPNLCTRQVYELATDIACEFENVVDSCGIETLNPLVLKVINVLEALETSVISLEASEKALSDLRLQNVQLQTKKNACESEKIKLEQDLEDLQENSDKETEQLKVAILKLREDNKRLHNSLQEHVSAPGEKDIPSDNCLIKCLRTTILSLNIKLEEKDAKLQELTDVIVKLQGSVDELTKANKALCCKVCEAQKKVNSLYKDESNLKQEIIEQKKLLKVMEQSLSEATQQKLDLEESLCLSNSSPSSLPTEETETMSSIESVSEEFGESFCHERELLLGKIFQLEEELCHAKKESECYRQQYLRLQSIHSQEKSMKRLCTIRQLFHFVRGVVVPMPENFRCF